MKKVLIISPYFPPINSADMQRVRMSLPFFEAFGWNAEVVTVKPEQCDAVKDNLLLESVPSHIKVHLIKVLSKKLTSKIGLGSIAIRSLWGYLKVVNKLLKEGEFDLIYFSTTQFPVCILGNYWKSKFNIPYIIDFQDPWHSNYYLDKPKNQRPRKHWFSYRLNKYLEPLALKNVDGLISVSNAYLETLHRRYPETKDVPCETITFGAFKIDFDVAIKHLPKPKSNNSATGLIKVVYVGRGGYDMQDALRLLFQAFKRGLKNNPNYFTRLRFYFIGTSYAPEGKGVETINPLAKELNLTEYVREVTNRIPFYEGLSTLMQADALFIPGSDDPQYTASKIYPYILAQKPLLAIFNPSSSAYRIIKECNAGTTVALQTSDKPISEIHDFLLNIKNTTISTDWEKFNAYSAENMTKRQCELFNKVVYEQQ